MGIICLPCEALFIGASSQSRHKEKLPVVSVQCVYSKISLKSIRKTFYVEEKIVKKKRVGVCSKISLSSF